MHTTRFQNFTIGTKIISLDSATLKQFQAQSLADLLAQQNFLFVKSYGSGVLATPSFRGTNANHTAVLWNGLNLQSSMNGQTDLSLLPLGFFNQAHLQMGGAGALFGSGAVGGVIHLGNKPEWNKGINARVNFVVGSFGHFQQQFQTSISSEKRIFKIGLINKNAENDFLFRNTALGSQPIDRQTNAHIYQNGLLAEAYQKIGNNNWIGLRYWLQNSDRGIPPTLLSGQNQNFQQDYTHRLGAEWQFEKDKFSVATRAAYFSEKIIFGRPYFDTSSNIAHTFQLESELNYKISDNQSFNIGLQGTHTMANGNNLPSNPYLSRAAVFGSYKIGLFNRKLILNANVRQQFSGEKVIPTPGIGMEVIIQPKSLVIKANISRNYRLPTFNDLYWKQQGASGNKNLKSEEGWSGDMGIYGDMDFQKTNLRVSLTGFYSSLTNQIFWSPNTGGILQPINILASRAMGFEYLGSISHAINSNWSLNLKTSYDFTISEIIDFEDKSLIGKQLIYVPYEKGFAELGIGFKRWSVKYNHAFTGFRYTREDNKTYLPAFSVGNIFISYLISYKKFSALIYSGLYNIFNENYQVMAGRPMPIINFLGGIQINFIQPKTN